MIKSPVNDIEINSILRENSMEDGKKNSHIRRWHESASALRNAFGASGTDLLERKPADCQ